MTAARRARQVRAGFADDGKCGGHVDAVDAHEVHAAHLEHLRSQAELRRMARAGALFAFGGLSALGATGPFEVGATAGLRGIVCKPTAVGFFGLDGALRHPDRSAVPKSLRRSRSCRCLDNTYYRLILHQ